MQEDLKKRNYVVDGTSMIGYARDLENAIKVLEAKRDIPIDEALPKDLP